MIRQVQIRHIFMFVVAMLLGALICVPGAMAKDSNYSRADFQAMYMQFLNSNGYAPTIDSDGDVRFVKDGHTFFISVDEADPECFRIVLANIWSIEDGIERGQVLMAADETNRSLKVVKLFAVKENTWASIETFIADPRDFKTVFPRSVSVLVSGAQFFAKKMKEMTSTAPSRSGASPKARSPENDPIGLL